MLKIQSFAVLFSMFFGVGHQVALAADPNIEWHKLETNHFEIIYDSKHYPLAKEFARNAETAWFTLTPVLRTWPDKTVIVIDDSTDQANGLATGFPYPSIRLFPAAPNPGETIADTGPWALELVMHEYTHVLNTQPAHGVFHPLRNIFGAIIRPNMLLPRWYLEGLAVEMETRFSPSGGRLRSPDFLAIPRAMIQDNLLRGEDMARINEVSIPDWPGGARPYLMGAMIWQSLTKRSLGIVGDLNDHFARRMPFFIEEPLRERLETEWQPYLESVYAETESRAVKQIEVICEGGCGEGEKLGEKGFYSRSPVLSPDGGPLGYIAREHNHDSVIMVAPRLSGGRYDVAEAQRLAQPTASNRIAWLPKGQALVYDGIDSVGRYEERSDLWLYDRERKRNGRLTKGLRAREPDVSLDGKTIAFVQLTPGGSRLAVVSLETLPDGGYKVGTARTIYTPDGENRVAWPTFIDEKTLVFVERNSEAQEGLKILSFDANPAAGGKRIGLRNLPTRGSATFPRPVRSAVHGKGLLFASNRTGVTNLYFARWQKDQGGNQTLEAPRPMTNSTTRAWVGDLDTKADTLVYARLDGDGSHLRSLGRETRELNESIRRGELARIPPLIERNDAKESLVGEEKFTPSYAKLSSAELTAHDFNAWPYMLPTYWMPYAAFLPGGAYLSASTAAADPLGRHMLVAALATDTRIGKPNAFLAYANATTPVKFTVLGEDSWQRLSTSGYDKRTTSGDISGMFYIPSFPNEWMAEVGISHQRSEIPLSTGNDVRIKGGPHVGLIWQDLSQKGLEISPEKGGSFKIGHRRFIPEIGNSVYDQTDLSAAENFSAVSHPSWLGWIADRHVINTSASVSWLPSLDRLLLGPSSVSLPVETVALSTLSTSFVMRGYPSGSFLARKVVRASIEYRFPLSYSYHGFNTSPAFVQRWHGAIFADGLTLDGAYYDYDAKVYRAAEFGPIYAAIGAEARMDSTIFYHVPVQFIFGLHYGFDKKINPSGAYPIISIAL